MYKFPDFQLAIQTVVYCGGCGSALVSSDNRQLIKYVPQSSIQCLDCVLRPGRAWTIK